MPIIVIAGQDYGAGSSRDWAAKVTRLLGVRAVIARGFERIHRSNLIGMGVMPCQFPEGVSAQTLALNGTERFDLALGEPLRPRSRRTCSSNVQTVGASRCHCCCESIRRSRRPTFWRADSCRTCSKSCSPGRNTLDDQFSDACECSIPVTGVLLPTRTAHALGGPRNATHRRTCAVYVRQGTA